MNPSLLLIPDRYKASKLYSQIPDSGAGDLAFTRALDTATRVNSAGLIEKVRTNFKIQSEQLTTAAGGLSFTDVTTITANTTETLDPFQTNKAEKFDGTSGQFADVYDTIATSVPNTSSIYAKAGTATSFDLRMSGAFGVAANAVFNLSNGTVTSSGGAELLSSKIELVGNGWYRCSISYNFTSLPTNRIALTATGSLYFFGWQLEATDFGSTPYIPTTTAAVSVGPVANIPRIDYTGGGCGKLLLEPQRTNLALFSEQFDNAAWSKFEAPITPNAIAAPDGTISADLILDTAVSQQHLAEQAISTGVGVHTWSVFAKAQNLNFLIINAFSGSSNRTWFNLSNGTIGTNAAGSTATITSYGNGWYRCSVTRNYTSGAFLFAASTAPSDGVFSYAGSGNGIYLWGAQVELGSYVSSYIPTLGASVTRSADAASKTGISSLIGQTEGVLYADITIPIMANTGANLVSMSLFNGGITNATVFDIYDTGILLAYHVNGTTQASILKTGFTAGRHKIAFAYKENDFVLYVDGVLVGTDTSGTVGAQDSFGLQYGTNQFIGQQYINTAATYPVRLSNSELASLTTL